MRVRYLCLLGILTGMPLLAEPFNYVTNGGFESGATSGVLTPAAGLNVYVFGVGGSTDIDGWTVSASSINNGSDTPLSVVVTANPPQQPASGTYAVDFDPSWNISTGALLSGPVTGTLPEISQTLSLPSGSYDLTFDGAVEQDGGVGTRPLTVTLSGAADLDDTVTTSETDDVGYTLFSFDFESTGGNVTLTFIPDDFSPEPNFMLDNVSVTSEAPEPGSLLPLLSIFTVALVRSVLGKRRKQGHDTRKGATTLTDDPLIWS